MATDPSSGGGGGGSATTQGDASRRTRLANERTELAWWRTGLTALAVGIGVGRVIPELSENLTEWPHVALGGAFAAYGVILIWYGNRRRRAVDAALNRGVYADADFRIGAALALAGAGLGVATGLLILFG